MAAKKRDYRMEYDRYQGSPEQIRNRSQRNKARRALEANGRVHKGDGMDVDHKRPISHGGSNSLSNLRIQTDNNNRSFKRNKKGGIK